MHSMQVFVDEAGRSDILCARAQQLIAERLRATGPAGAIHLGEIHVTSPNFAV